MPVSIFYDYTFWVVAAGCALLGAISGVLGCFAVIRKEGLIGDAVSHSALLGIAAAFLMTGTKRMETLLLGALLAGLLGTFFVNTIRRYSKIKFDSALALILSVFFGGGLVLLTYIQKKGNANQAGLDKFIFGQASALLLRDVKLMAAAGGVLLLLTILFWKEFKLISFDMDFAKSLGFNTRLIAALNFAMIVLSIVLGLQTVGVVLMSAMLVAPPVAARQWTNRLNIMVLLSAFFGALSGVLGTVLSSSAQKLPTGPVIVVIISSIVLLSLFIAPRRGLIWRRIRLSRGQKAVGERQVLESLYALALNHEKEEHSHDIAAISSDGALSAKGEKALLARLRGLRERGLCAECERGRWCITDKGTRHVLKHYGERGAIE